MTMRRLAIVSDFHLDSNHFDSADLTKFADVLQAKKITDLHFAGDMSNDFHGLTEEFFDHLTGQYDLTYNLGNHDMLSLSEAEIDRSDFLIKPLGGKTLLAFHGWYDYSFYEGDQSKILHFKNNFYFDRKIQRELNDITTTQKILSQLDEILSNLTGEVIVAMHFVPHRQFTFHTRYEKFAKFNAFLGSQKFHEIFVKYPNVKEVVFGHIHHRFSATKIDGITYHVRPLGYSYDWAMIDKFQQEFPESQISENYKLKKRYNAIKKLDQWPEFRRANLTEEFRQALTIFEL